MEQTKSTVILSKEDLIKEQNIIKQDTTDKEIDQAKEIQKQEIIIEVEKDKTLDTEKIINIEIEMYENALSNILLNLNSLENVVVNSINLINNIKELSNNKFRLFVWVSRLLVITNTYNLRKIKEKLIEAIKSLGYEKFLNYINIHSPKQINLNYIFEEVILEENYERVKDGLREVIRYLIQNGFAGNFIKIYKKLKEKYPQEKIEDIFV
ncbi:MAG: hypothetical protein ACK4ZM_04825, partial [bacterium]